MKDWEVKTESLDITLRIRYSSEEELKQKKDAILSLLKEISLTKNVKDYILIKELIDFIRWNTKKNKYFWISIFIWLFSIFTILNVSIGLGIGKWWVQSNIYLWQKYANANYIENGNLKNWIVNIEWCGKHSCITNKWIIPKVFINKYLSIGK